MGRSNNKRKGRVNNYNARQTLPLSQIIQVSPVKYNQIPSNNLRLFEDRRNWHPEGAYAPAKSFNSSRHRLKDRFQTRKSHSVTNSSRYRAPLVSVVSSIGFKNPKKVLVCVRRNIRKQVLHALKKTGRVGQRRPRYNWYSKIRCK